MAAPFSWMPDKAALQPPIYLCLAQQLEQDIRSGKLAPHTRLPAQRELAEYLQVNLSTITRVLKICEKKGLVYATVGRGTFVSPDVGLPYPDFQNSKDCIILDEIKPFYQCNPLVLETAEAILHDRNAARLFQLQHAAVSHSHKIAAQKWLSWFHIHARPEHILLLDSARNALALSFLALFAPGDAIAADPCVFPSLIHLAKQLRLRLIPIEGDAQGMLPDALARQFGLAKIKGVVLSPTCQNPTGISIPPARREEIAETAERYNLAILEYEPYLFLSNSGALPFAAILPEQTVHIHSISKALAPLGAAYVTAPSHLRQKMKTAAALSAPPLLNAEILSAMIKNGTALQILARKRKLSTERNSLSQRYFPLRPGENPYSLFRFLPMPAVCDGAKFERLAKSKGIRLFCSERFSLDGQNLHAFRAAICSPAAKEDLEKAMQILKALAERPMF